MVDFSNLELSCEEEWVPFPVVPDIDIGYWATHTAADIAERFAQAGEPGDIRRLEKDLKHLAADSRTREPLAAFGWYLNGYNTAVAVMELDYMVPDSTYPKLSLSLVTDKLSIDDFGAPEVRETELPLGPASRIRQNVIGSRKKLFGPRPIVRTLTYVVLPTGTDVAMTLRVTWLEPVIDEPLEETVDKIARTLTL